MPKKRYFGYHSGFAKDIEAFIEYKLGLGFSLDSYRYLKPFDAFCAEKHPDACELTQEIVVDWCTTSEEGLSMRCYTTIREFGKYLFYIAQKPAYIYPYTTPVSRDGRLPYIISKEEQARFFDAADNLPSVVHTRIAEYTAPVVFRLMLGCGLRPREIVNLCRRHLDFQNGTIYIENSKNHHDRRIAVSEDLMDLCHRYDCIAECFFPNRTYFFANRYGEQLKYPGLEHLFNRTWDLSGNDVGDGRPSLYSFRFTYATETLMRWIEEGRDIEAMIPYLSAYMGHTEFKHTYYYIRLLPDRIREMQFMSVAGVVPEVNQDEWL